jgi:pyruvate/2-oxoglutarate dehydrogenase complex dihydrolipoamide acyltransferase (E2) component
MQMVQKSTGQIVTVPDVVGPISVGPNGDPMQLVPYGYLLLPDDVLPGFKRIATGYVDSGDGIHSIPFPADMSQADYDAAQAAAAQAAAVAQTAANAAAQQAAQASYSAAVALVTPLAHQYRALLRQYFGPNAETSQTVTQAAVMGYFLQLDVAQTITTQQTADAALLQTIFQIIEPLANDGVTSAPNTWGAAFWALVP